MNKFQELVRSRLRDRTPNYTTLATFLKTDPSTIQKRLKEGGTALCLDWLDAASTFYQMSVAEMCALPESVWQEVKPLEAQLLLLFREMTELERRSLLDVLDRPPKSAARRARPGRAELTPEQQLLVDLYVKSEAQQRDGVMKILRGTARVGRTRQTRPGDTSE